MEPEAELLAALACVAEWATGNPEIWSRYIRWADGHWNAHKPAPLTEEDHAQMLDDTMRAAKWADYELRRRFLR